MTVLSFDTALADLISPLGGVVAGVDLVEAGERFVARATLGDVDSLRGTTCFGRELDGLGCDADPQVAAHRAVYEALERYSASAPTRGEVVVASWRELGDAAMDMEAVASCSVDELALAGCPVVAFDADASLRWVRGWSLLDGRLVWVPLVMAALGVAVRHAGERFWMQTSSGCAIGWGEAQALESACVELIERDAMAVSWLTRRPLCKRDVVGETAVYDATSDVGVPVAMAVSCTGEPAAGAACAETWELASEKACREVDLMRVAVSADRLSVPREAFAHLRVGGGFCGGDLPIGGLSAVLERMARVCEDVVAVDLTPVELDGTGLRVVRVVAAPLVPYLADPHVRYLASPRVDCAEVNQWPSPLL